MHEQDIRKFYDLLEQKNTEVRAISFEKVIDNNNKTKWLSKIEKTIEVNNYTDFLNFCKQWDSKANLYAGIHERLQGGTKTQDVIAIKIIALDIDANHPTGEAATDKELEICKKEVFEMVKELETRFSRPSIVMSGNGFQLIWRIKPINLNDKNRDTIEKRLKKFIDEIKMKYTSPNKKIDQIGDLARILKIAGTMSIKGEDTKERPFRLSCFIEYNSDTSELIRDELLCLDVNQETTRTLITQSSEQNTFLGKFDNLLTKDPKLSALYYGDLTNFESRSEAELSLVCKLVFYEFSDGEIDLIMRGCAIGKWKDGHKSYKDLTLRKAKLFMNQKKDLKDIRLDDVYNVINKWLYMKDLHSVDLMLATVLSQRLKGTPVWIIFVGASGDGKSEMVRMIDNLECVYKLDQLTPNTFVSGNPKIEDLAPQLDNKIVVITDFASILSLNGDAQRMIFAQLRNLYDGEAYKDSGAGARKHYSGMRITLIANSTPIINHKILIHQDLGTRELLYKTDNEETFEDFQNKALKALDNESKKNEMRKEIQTVVNAFLANIQMKDIQISDEIKEFCPRLLSNEEILLSLLDV